MQQQKSVYKINAICAEQIVLLGQTGFVTTEAESKFSLSKKKKAITCMLQRFMHP